MRGRVRIETRAPQITNILNPIDKYINFFLNCPVACLAFNAKSIPRTTRAATINTATNVNVGWDRTKLEGIGDGSIFLFSFRCFIK